jgi:hypothetical protein
VIFSHTVSGLDSVLGGVPPGGWRITSDALLASGWLDVSTPVGQKIRNMLKRGALSWSIGFFDDRAARRTERNGTTTIGRVTDIVELSVVATPSNVRTTTSIKSSDGDELRRPTHTQLEQRLREEGIIARINPAIDLEDDVWLARLKARRNGGADLEDAEGKTASAAGARQAPITIATFRVD